MLTAIDPKALQHNDVSDQEIQRRYLLSYEAKARFDSMTQKIDEELFAFEKHMYQDDVIDDVYRFPELFGVAIRKYSNLIEVLPEMTVKSKNDTALLLQAAIESEKNKSNLTKQRHLALWDSIATGYGWLFAVPVEHYQTVRVDGKVSKVLAYRGYAAERVDPRDIIPAYSAVTLHDHTGAVKCPFLFRRRIYYFDSFLSTYRGREEYNQEVVNKVMPSSFEGNFGQQSRINTKAESNEKYQGQDYVICLEYWDPINDIFRVYANDWENKILDSKNGIPYSHKQLPFHVYYNYTRKDSIFGISELALNMPYVQFKETITNLEIDNITLELQPAYIVDANINFNEEEHKLQPGAIFNVKGMGGGKLQDHIMPFRVGGVTADVPGVINQVESSQIAVTGDDFKSLYANPNQLATQTLSKREALLKRTRTNVAENMANSEYYLHLQLASYIKNELSLPFEDQEGKTQFTKVKIRGFDIDQPRSSSKVRGVLRKDGAESEFYLNEKVAKDFDETEIEVVPISVDEQLKRDKIEKLILFMQEIFKVLQLPAGQELLASMDVNDFVSQIALQLGLDVSKMLPNVQSGEHQSSVEDAEYNMIAKGEVPTVNTEKYDPVQRYMSLLEFRKTPSYESLQGSGKAAFEQFSNNLINNVKPQTSTPQPGIASLQSAAGFADQGPVVEQV